MLEARISTRLALSRLDANDSFRAQAYLALKQAISAMDLYDHPGEIRLDERQLCRDLGVSRTPIREALTVLEQEGFVLTLPRRGIFVRRRTRRQIVEMVQVWAALESMSARLAAARATDAEIAALRGLFEGFEGRPAAEIEGYSDANIAFHRAIVRLGGNGLIIARTADLFLQIDAIRRRTIREDDRADRSIQDHLRIIEALERRDADLAARLDRDHTLGLAEHIERNCHFLA
ncbi:GntR family transcriptional regulator [Mycobacterium sp. KBS0706]|uniref:GntR family transcriptional regulator n=1 Tax=Mycobacterium sp. KBS0706 TaxID=2578109 RepID=UPI001C8F5CF4|nr:GntR family transcriptional regulator [Mycobacterium sp. KBS0706]